MDDLVPLRIAAKRLGVHITTLRAWVRDGRIPSYRLGQRFTRVRWPEVLEALSRERTESTHAKDRSR